MDFVGGWYHRRNTLRALDGQRLEPYCDATSLLALDAAGVDVVTVMDTHFVGCGEVLVAFVLVLDSSHGMEFVVGGDDVVADVDVVTKRVTVGVLVAVVRRVQALRRRPIER